MKLQDMEGAGTMAAMLLCVMSAPLTGCLFPQDEQLIPDLPPARNRPLKIVTQAPLDPLAIFYNSTVPSCLAQNPNFAVTVEDDDTGDQVRSRWFVGSTTSQPFQPGNVTTGTPPGSPTRVVTAPTALNFKTALASLSPGTEVLTVYVADTEIRVIDGQVSLEPRGPKVGATADDKGSIDSFSWTLDVRACP